VIKDTILDERPIVLADGGIESSKILRANFPWVRISPLDPLTPGLARECSSTLIGAHDVPRTKPAAKSGGGISVGAECEVDVSVACVRVEAEFEGHWEGAGSDGRACEGRVQLSPRLGASLNREL